MNEKVDIHLDTR